MKNKVENKNVELRSYVVERRKVLEYRRSAFQAKLRDIETELAQLDAVEKSRRG